MPEGNLPAHAKEIYNAAESNALKTACKGRSDPEACAAKIAWSAVKKKYRQEGDRWVRKADVAEFSMAITRAAYEKSNGAMRFKAVASDTEEDTLQDNMSVELFKSFIQRIRSEELVPERYRSAYWSGGKPYLSVSHYTDLDGKGVPGILTTADGVYIDGAYLKAKGEFYDNALGRACFRSVCDDLYSDEPKFENPVRISIAFLDLKHRHKADDSIFVRESEDHICIKCLLGLDGGKEFLDGHLIHLAFTRVPVNERTQVEVDKSMADEILTRKDDAEAIVGAELAEELDEETKALVGKSQAMVIKSEPEEADDLESKGKYSDDEEDEEEENKKKKMEKKSEVADEDPSATREAEVSEVSESEVTLGDVLEAIKSLSTVEEPKPAREPHILEGAIADFLGVFDEVYRAQISQDEKYEALRPALDNLGQEITKHLVEEEQEAPTSDNVLAELAQAVKSLSQDVGMLKTQLTQGTESPKIPARRSVQVAPSMPVDRSATPAGPKTPEEIARRSVYG